MLRANREDKVQRKPFLEYMTKGQKIAVVVLSLVMLFLSVALPLLLNFSPSGRIRLSREYKVGELSDETVLSPMDFSFLDEDMTKILKDEARNRVLPQFSFEVSNSLLMRSRADNFLRAMNIEDDNERKAALDEFIASYSLKDTKNVLSKISSLSATDRVVVASLIREAISEAISRGIIGSEDLVEISENRWTSIEMETLNTDDLTIESQIENVTGLLSTFNLSSFAMDWVASYYPDFPAEYLEMIAEAISLMAVSNVSYDQIYTEELMEEKANEIEPVYIEIKKGDVLLERDRLVTRDQLYTIEQINSQPFINEGAGEIVGKTLLSFVVISVYLVFAIRSIAYDYRKGQFSIIGLSFFIFCQLADFLIVYLLLSNGYDKANPFLPMFIAPMLMSAFTNKPRDGIYIGILFGALQVLWPTSNMYTFFFIVISVTFCLMSMRVSKERLSTIVQWSVALVLEALTVSLFALLLSYTLAEYAISLLGVAINLTISFILYSVALPIFERIFNIPTVFRLHDLSFTDNPTLKALNEKALGTFNHSKNVSEMAYEAASAIGANAELARVGGLYHDIGKEKNPEYFIENQGGGENIHNSIKTNLSVSVIKQHVKNGVEKGKEIKLPQEVIDIIGEHHGNDLIKYFYDEAVKRANGRVAVSEEDFRYNANIPSTPESGIVMLADSAEAATRTIKNPSHQRYDKFITKIFADKIAHNQLNNSKLTITDLDKIKEAFIHYLMGRDHSRIKYEGNDDD